MQVLNLVLTGGEPLAHPDFLRLGRRARELGFVLRIKSNGHALRGALARRIKEEIDPFVVELSLHGARAETHERQTRVPGSFERLLANIREMLALGFRLKLNSTLTAWNEGEIEEMHALADALGVRLNIGSEVSPRDDGDRNPLAISASPEGLVACSSFSSPARAERERRSLPLSPHRSSSAMSTRGCRWRRTSTAARAPRPSRSTPMETSIPASSGAGRSGTCRRGRSRRSGPVRRRSRMSGGSPPTRRSSSTV